MDEILIKDIIDMLERYKVDEETLDDKLHNEINDLIIRINNTLVEINKRYVGEVIYVEISALGKIQSPDYDKVSCRIVEVHDDYLIVEINGVPVIDPSYKVYKISYLDFTL